MGRAAARQRTGITACARGLIVASLTCLMAVGGATRAAAQLRAEVVASGLRTPVAVIADPTAASVFFVVEQSGLIRVVRDGELLTVSFLDLRSSISSGGERGLLGMALAPDYETSRRVFVNFTNVNGDTVVARFLRRADDPLQADPATRFDLQWPGGQRVIDQPFANHNGGHLLFGPEGYLYIGLGDGGSGGDPMNAAQDPRTLLGKMLRIDINVPDDDPRGYRVPDDNPFVDGTPVAALGEIWAFGLRNPWRYSFDDWTRGGTSALTIGDVGQNAREEINFEPRGPGGRNYGWRLREGRQQYDTRTPPAFLPLTMPIHDYGRSFGASVTGGLIYRGAALDPRFNGRYFFADFVSGRVFSLGLDLHPLTSEATAQDEEEHTAALGATPTLGMVSSFGTDRSGEMLVLNYSAGRLLRVVPDFTLVPQAPAVAGATDGDQVHVTWTPSAEGVATVSYFVEVVRNGAVIERIETDRHDWTTTGEPGDCLRVRPIGRSGAGPASPAVCLPVISTALQITQRVPHLQQIR